MNPNDPSETVYLSPEVKLEPLVCRWYAWPHLLSPVQLALHVTYRLLPLLQSFAGNPMVHVAANRDPKMYGGPFMSLKESDAPAVRALAKDTTATCAALITLAQDLHELVAGLPERASGYSFNDFYGALPASLKGLVEFLYDVNNQPSVRLFEPLVYAEHRSVALQEVMLHRIGEHDRSFFMSTPRLQPPDSLSFKMKFSDKRIDALSLSRMQPASLRELAALLEVKEADLPLFRSFFTPTAPQPKDLACYGGDGVRMRFFGHACVLFQTRDVAVLFDPCFALEPHDDGRFTMADLPDFIDHVVLTHSHQDHFNVEMLVQLRHRIGRVVVPRNNSGSITDPSMKLGLHELGFEQVDVLDVLESVKLPGGEILSVPFTGEHADLDIYSKQAIALSLKGHKFLFLIDSDCRDVVLYRRLMQRIDRIDALFIGMECHGAPLNWLYEPLLAKPLSRRNNEARRLSGANCERAWNILRELGAPQVFVYAMGQDPWMNYIMGLEYTSDSIQLIESEKLLQQCKQAGIAAERLTSGREVVYLPT